MKTYSFDLNIGFQAEDETKAFEIMEAIAALVREKSGYKLDYVDADDLEEN